MDAYIKKWEPWLHVLLWLLVLLFPYIKYFEKEGGYPESFLHEVNTTLFIMIPCYATYFWWLRLSAGKRKSTLLLLLLIFIGSAILYEFTDSMFHDESFKPFMWKQLFSSLVKYAAFAMVFVAFYQLKKTVLQQQKIQQIHNEKRQAELKAIKAQITPHFLFNTLNGIYVDALKVDEPLAKTILMLSDNTRYFLKEGQEIKVPIAKEIQHINNYLALQKHRLVDKIEVQVVDEIKKREQPIAPLLLIPLVENAIKYTSMLRGNGHVITIEMKENNDYFIFKCNNPRNDSIENTLDNNWKNSGIGLENVKKRLTLLYPEKHELTITEKPNNFKVHLTIKLC